MKQLGQHIEIIMHPVVINPLKYGIKQLGTWRF